MIRQVSISSTFILSLARVKSCKICRQKCDSDSTSSFSLLSTFTLLFVFASVKLFSTFISLLFYYFSSLFHPSNENKTKQKTNQNAIAIITKRINLEDPWIVTIKNALTKINATERTWPPFIQYGTLKI